MQQNVSGRTRKRSRGFTLIEIAVVVAILAILALLLVPRLAFVRTMSTYASEATSIQDVTQNMLLYHTTQAVWPDHLDSLCDSTTPASLYGKGAVTAYGLDSNLAGVLTTTALTNNQLKSLVGLLGQPNGINPSTLTVMDHDQTTSKPGNSGTVARDITAASADLHVATVNFTGANLPSDPNAASATVIYDSVYPTAGTSAMTWPDGHTEVIVALGLGPSCTAVGKTIVSPPAAYMKDDTRYNRTIVLVRVRSDGVQASLAGGLAPDGRTIDQCLGNYRVTAQR